MITTVPDSVAVDNLAELAGQQFSTVYADPPWSYGNQGTRASTDNHYPTMTLDEIAGLSVVPLSAPDAYLHLWTTNAFLRQAFDIIDAWGFEYRSCFVWVKPQMGLGNYWRVSHEYLLLGTRGNPPAWPTSPPSWIKRKRTRHSEKPEDVRKMIEAACPGPYLELFGRRRVAGWTVFGNEVT